jgi:hypothetical protein
MHTMNYTRSHLLRWSMWLIAELLMLGVSIEVMAAPPPPVPPRVPPARPRATVVASRPTPVATPVKVADPIPALSACACDIFGLSLAYTKAGGLSGQIVRTLSIPTPAQGTISAAINANGTALYGLTNNSGVQTLVYGSGSASAGNVSVTISQGSLCYLQFISTQAPPANKDAALALLKSTFPGVPQQAPYVATATKTGYAFYIATVRPVSGTTQKQTQAILLTVISNANGKLLLSATSGIGTYSSTVPKQ